ncbi:MAG: citrate lyase holo-[acyl-carrier protein] synthase [Treponema sp.]|nr:citrate lyase holo-[acyl-carrier protein] synthase [Treponema sp.]
MNTPTESTTDNTVTVAQMAQAREERAFLQKQLLDTYHKPLVCFMLNIPGPVKVRPEYRPVFDAGLQKILTACKAHDIAVLEQKTRYPVTGYEFYAVLDAQPLIIKKELSVLEEETPIGRLYDIDVLTPDLQKISREELGLPPRKCLICNNDAHVCGRNRTHTVAQMIEAIFHLIQSDSK